MSNLDEELKIIKEAKEHANNLLKDHKDFNETFEKKYSKHLMQIKMVLLVQENKQNFSN